MVAQDEGRLRLAQLVQDLDTAMLTTFDDEGELHSRPMLTLHPGSDGILWFATDLRAHSVADVGREHQVAVSYVDVLGQRYVSVSGWAELIRDRSLARSLWREPLHAWFPRGPEELNFALLRVTVERAEYWEGGSGRKVELVSAPVSRFAPERYLGDDHADYGPH